jgi:hypothetical protein
VMGGAIVRFDVYDELVAFDLEEQSTPVCELGG